MSNHHIRLWLNSQDDGGDERQVTLPTRDWILILALLAGEIELIRKDNTSAREHVKRLHEYIRSQVQP